MHFAVEASTIAFALGVRVELSRAECENRRGYPQPSGVLCSWTPDYLRICSFIFNLKIFVPTMIVVRFRVGVIWLDD